jgi:Acetyltransferase (GNAT) domain
VLDNYEAVMPLTWNKKYGICYLYQPFYAACLGLFGNKLTPALLNDFLQLVPRKFRYWDIYLNHGNYFMLENYNLYQRMNYVLALDQPYTTIAAGYRENVKRNIRKAGKLQCVVKTGIAVEDVIALAIEQAGHFSTIKPDDFERVKLLYQRMQQQAQATTYGVYSPGDQLVASAAFFFYRNRAYYILVGNHPNGKTIGASHALIDAFIKDHSGRDLLLDFEGSDIQNIAFFYSSFGATEEKYCGLRYNNLPRLLRYFKK